MIYPLLYKTITQYRGPKFDSELSKFFISASNDISTVYNSLAEQEKNVLSLTNLHISGIIDSSIEITTSMKMNDVAYSFISTNELTGILDNASITLSELKKNIY